MKIGKTRLDVVFGDITGQDTEAIVNPANDMLWYGGGVSSTIRKAGGESLETEAMAKAPAEKGSAVVTGGGNLSRWIIHAVISGQDLTTGEDVIGSAAEAVMKRADEIRCASLAIPLIDTAGYGVEIHVAAGIVVDRVVDYLVREKSHIERVVFVEHDTDLRGVYDTALHEKFSSHGR